MIKKLKSKQLSISFAVWSALLMFILWLLANLGIYVSAANMMSQWHIFFNLSFTGLIGGMIEAAVASYILTTVFVWIYNWIGEK